MKWLKESIWPKEEEFKKEQIKVGTSLAFLEMIKSGTTTFNDMYLHEREIIESTVKAKIRGFLGYALMEEGWRTHFKRSKELHYLIISLQYDKMINYTVAPHGLYLLGEEALNEIAIYAKEKGVIIHIHIAETKMKTLPF